VACGARESVHSCDGGRSPGLAHRVDANLVVTQARSFEDLLAGSLFLPRVAATLLGFLGLLAVVVASAGLFGMVSYDVSSRTREIGIRLSLAVDRRDLVRQVLQDSAQVAAAGAAVGLRSSVGLARVTEASLFGVLLVTLVAVPIGMAVAVRKGTAAP
jgi:putative ABC transport system permease protein